MAVPPQEWNPPCPRYARVCVYDHCAALRGWVCVCVTVAQRYAGVCVTVWPRCAVSVAESGRTLGGGLSLDGGALEQTAGHSASVAAAAGGPGETAHAPEKRGETHLRRDGKHTCKVEIPGFRKFHP